MSTEEEQMPQYHGSGDTETRNESEAVNVFSHSIVVQEKREDFSGAKGD